MVGAIKDKIETIAELLTSKYLGSNWYQMVVASTIIMVITLYPRRNFAWFTTL